MIQSNRILSACDQIVEKLVLLQIWKKHSMMGGTVGITMTKSFQDNIRTSITGGYVILDVLCSFE